MSIRPIKRIVQSKPTMEGAGVKLRRAFGFGTTSEFDPFLLLDDFRNDRPDDYSAGFPWHPHRGIETITYVLAGTVEHGDSLGNVGKMGPGEMRALEVGGQRLVVCSISGALYAYRDTCAACGSRIDAGGLEGQHLTCPSCVNPGSPMPKFASLGPQRLHQLAVFLEASKGTH